MNDILTLSMMYHYSLVLMISSLYLEHFNQIELLFIPLLGKMLASTIRLLLPQLAQITTGVK